MVFLFVQEVRAWWMGIPGIDLNHERRALHHTSYPFIGVGDKKQNIYYLPLPSLAKSDTLPVPTLNINLPRHKNKTASLDESS